MSSVAQRLHRLCSNTSVLSVRTSLWPDKTCVTQATAMNFAGSSCPGGDSTSSAVLFRSHVCRFLFVLCSGMTRSMGQLSVLAHNRILRKVYSSDAMAVDVVIIPLQAGLNPSKVLEPRSFDAPFVSCSECHFYKLPRHCTPENGLFSGHI